MKDPILRSDRPSPLSAKEAGSLAERLAHAGGVKPVFMRKFIKEVIAVIEEGLLRDGEVRIHNFGTFRLSQPQVPAGIRAKIGEAAALPERPQVIFQPSKNLRGLINLSLGATIPAGRRISLQALLEKHLPILSPPAAPKIEDSAPEFDIVENFPNTEGMDESGDYGLPWQAATLPVQPKAGQFLPKESGSDFENKPLISSPAFALAEGGAKKEPAAEVMEPGEAIPETASDTVPTFTFAEPAKETTVTFSPSEEPPASSTPSISRRRSRRFVWYAGAAAVFLLLLLFLLPGRISEKSETASSSVPTPVEVAEQPSFQNGVKRPGAEPKPADSKPAYESAAYFAGGTHRVVAGDNLWEISGNYYRNHYLWPNIYRANTATIQNPDILQIDQSLGVPALYGPPEKLTAADRRNLAEGYFLLYRYYKENASSLAPYALWAAVQYDAAVKIEHAAELSNDDLAFLQAHGVRRALAER